MYSEYGDVFSGLGCLPGQIKIQLRKDAQPVVHAARNVPIALRDKLKTELEEEYKTEEKITEIQ